MVSAGTALRAARRAKAVLEGNPTKQSESGGIAARAERLGNAPCAGLQPVEQTTRPEKFRSQDGEPGKNHEPARARGDQKNHANGEECEPKNRFDGSFNLSHSDTPKSGGFGWASVATPKF